jgi:hypothetical protein
MESLLDTSMASGARPATLLDTLSLISGGRATISVSGFPLVSLRSDEKELDIELSGAKRAGVRLSELVRLEEGGANILVASERVADKLAGLRWRLNLYDRGSKVLTMGSGVSRLTGHVTVNPLRLKALLEALG